MFVSHVALHVIQLHRHFGSSCVIYEKFEFGMNMLSIRVLNLCTFYKERVRYINTMPGEKLDHTILFSSKKA